MKSQASPRRVSLQIIEQVVGKEMLVYHEGRHEAFCLDPISSAVWRLCDGDHSIAQIAEKATLELTRPVTEEIVEFALQELRGRGLLESDEVAVRAPVTRRALLERLGAGAALMLPIVAMIAAPQAAQAYNGGGFSPDVERGGAEPSSADPFSGDPLGPDPLAPSEPQSKSSDSSTSWKWQP